MRGPKRSVDRIPDVSLGKISEAMEIWEEALNLIPEPQQFYSEAIWFLVAIGDVYFQKKLYSKAHEYFDKARGNLSGEGYGNPFIKQTRRERMELSIQERLKDLRVECSLTLEQLAEQTHLSKSALAAMKRRTSRTSATMPLIKPAKFYGVTTDYLLGLSETKNHPNANLADLRLGDDMIELLNDSKRLHRSRIC